MALYLLALAAAGGDARAMSPPLPSLSAALPATGLLAPNAALVLYGRPDGAVLPNVTLARGGVPAAPTPVTVTTGPMIGWGYGAMQTWLVRPEKGDWPAGAELALAAAYEKGKPPARFEVKIGPAPDSAPPAPVKLGPGRIEKVPRPMLAPADYHLLPYPALADADGMVLAKIVLLDPEAKGARPVTVDAAILPGAAGVLYLDPALRRCLGAELRDTAGNVTKIPASDCTGAK
jgi:hypothetical protein